MNTTMQEYFNRLDSGDKNAQYEAYLYIMEAIDDHVDWAYEVWDQLKEDLTHTDNHKRSRAAQFLAGLAKSDPEKRMLHDVKAIWEVTHDPMFVTARHSLQSIWKVGLAGEEQLRWVLHAFIDRYKSCTSEKNASLIRSDILQGLKHLYDATNDEEIRIQAEALIEGEEDLRVRKKLNSIWKGSRQPR